MRIACNVRTSRNVHTSPNVRTARNVRISHNIRTSHNVHISRRARTVCNMCTYSISTVYALLMPLSICFFIFLYWRIREIKAQDFIVLHLNCPAFRLADFQKIF